MPSTSLQRNIHKTVFIIVFHNVSCSDSLWFRVVAPDLCVLFRDQIEDVGDRSDYVSLKAIQ